MLPLTVELMTSTSRATTYRLCSLKGYTSVEAIVADALVAGPCRTFVLWFLHLSR